MSNIRIGNEYWVLVDLDHDYIIGANEYHNVKHCIFKNLLEDEGLVKYVFYPIEVPSNHEKFYDLYEWEIDQWVFESIDDYLYYLVMHVNNINSAFENNDCPDHTFDDFVKQKILESQENRPEIWV